MEHVIREDLSAYSFQKYAATYFMSNVSHNFSKRPLKSSLLDLPLLGQLSAQVMCILWFQIPQFLHKYITGFMDNHFTIHG